MCHSDDQRGVVKKARSIFATYMDMIDLIRLGAYHHGSNPEIDHAIVFSKKLEEFLTQDYRENHGLEESFSQLEQLLLSST